jgi:hypothetical protein
MVQNSGIRGVKFQRQSRGQSCGQVTWAVMGTDMTILKRALVVAAGFAMLGGCSAKPEWDNTQATMDPHERFAQDMKAKQDAAPPIPAAPKAPVAATTAAPATAQAQAPVPKAQ